ncbi:pol-like protein [Apostichopus japonicus]|uniref:Pol-like protein n=2 Tax=Stichopus japonicus TaxID=307972 RepID=A0A2G8JMH0_STIJA|nr:pol-like protein [Apostichopus japonicus]
MMTFHDLIDIWRERNPLSKHFTWSSNVTHGIHCRLDFFLVSRNLANSTSNVRISPGIQSDHSFVHLKFSIHSAKRGPGYWKFNNSLLDDVVFVELITKLISTELSSNNNTNSTIQWELLKFKIRSVSMKYSKDKAKERRLKETDLLSKISDLECQLFQNECPNIRAKLRNAQTELLTFYDYKLKGTIIRSRARWVEEGEKNTSFFNELDHPQLTLDDSSSCDGPLDLEECFSALSSMKNDKAPGSDGLTANFYKKFWHIIGQVVINSLNSGFQEGALTAEQSRGIITVILKPGKDSTLLKNYRPITLLNTDYKIGAKAIAARLKCVIHKIIGPNQTGFMKGKFIGENIRFVLDLIDYASNHNIPGLLFLIDFEKAFDKLEWNFIDYTLSFFSFGNSLREWINVFYKRGNACVCNNGFSTGFFNIQRGVRQGCPLSPYLFILCVEVLALKVISNVNIKGIRVGNNVIKLSQYADDTTFFLDGSRDSFEETLSVLDDFRLASGLAINISKCNIMPLGSFINNLPTCINDLALNVTTGPVTMLGVSFTQNRDDLFRLNYQPKLSRLKKCLRVWSGRDLTPIGRNIIVKTFALSQLVFLFLVLPNPPIGFIKELESIIFDFIWGGSSDKVKRSSMINRLADGGLKVIHINSFINSLKCTWIKRYCNDIHGPWKIFFDLELYKLGKQFLFQCNCNKRDISIPNNFVSQIIKAWCEISFNNPTDNYGNQFLWNNSYIRINNQIVFYKFLYEANVKYVRDLYGENGRPLTFHFFRTKFNLPMFPFTIYTGLINAIPLEWRRDYVQNCNFPNCNEIWLDKVLHSNSTSQCVYSRYLDKVAQIPTASRKWANVFNNLTTEDWNRFYSIPWATVSESKIQYFQFRVLHRIIGTNKLLHTIGKSDSPNCTFCDTHIESIEHLFWECSVTSTFILGVEAMLLNKQFFFSKKDILLGFGVDVAHPYNFLILYMKHFIFQCKLNKCIPVVEDFFYKFKFTISVKKYTQHRYRSKSKVNFMQLKQAFRTCDSLFH